jgi:hypothetical protein
MNDGLGVIVGKDWNVSRSMIMKNKDFATLSLFSAGEEPQYTCPTFLPARLRKDLDHLFVSPKYGLC